MPYQTTEMDKIWAKKLGLDTWTYEDYLKLLELDNLYQKRKIEVAAKGDVKALSEIAANGIMDISLKIGCLNAIHPDWFEKHFPELAAQNEKEEITGTPHKVSKGVEQFQKLVTEKIQHNKREVNRLLDSYSELDDLNKLHTLIYIEYIKLMYSYESLNDLSRLIEKETGCHSKAIYKFISLYMWMAKRKHMDDYKKTSWSNLDDSIAFLDKIKNESIGFERVYYADSL